MRTRWVVLAAVAACGGSGGSRDANQGGSAGAVVCVDSSGPHCTTGQVFLSSSSQQSGCYPSGTSLADPITPAFDNIAGPCSSGGDVVIQCTTMCGTGSYCAKPTATVPPGCSKI